MSVVSSVCVVECDVSAESVAAVNDGGSLYDDVYVAADDEVLVDCGVGTDSDIEVAVVLCGECVGNECAVACLLLASVVACLDGVYVGRAEKDGDC